MAEFIQSTLEYAETGLIVGSVHTYDLPVNPLSFALITFKLTAETPSATDIPNLQKVADMLDKIEVLYKGSAVYSMDGFDCLASGLLVNKYEPWGCNWVDTAGAIANIQLLVALTRKLYSPVECFPRTTRGELIMQLTVGTIDADWSNVDMQIETVELPNATPSQFIKQTTKVATPAATGQYDIELPIGNDIDSLIINGESIPCGAVNTKTINRLEILVDNINHFYPESQFETINSMAGILRPPPGHWGFHTHETPVTPVVAGDPTSAPVITDHLIPSHLFLPFDIFRDGEYALHTAGASDVVLRIDVGVASEQIRVIPVEIVKSAGAV